MHYGARARFNPRQAHSTCNPHPAYVTFTIQYVRMKVKADWKYFIEFISFNMTTWTTRHGIITDEDTEPTDLNWDMWWRSLWQHFSSNYAWSSSPEKRCDSKFQIAKSLHKSNVFQSPNSWITYCIDITTASHISPATVHNVASS